MKKKDMTVKMKYSGQIVTKIPGVGKVEPNSTFDCPEGMSANLAKDPFFDIVKEGKDIEDKEKTKKGNKDKKDSKKNPPELPQKEKEVKDDC